MICKRCKDSLYAQAFSSGNCKYCNTVITSAVSPAPKVCGICASMHNVCERCGEPLEGRPTKFQNYLDIAKTVAKRGTCLRRNYGAIIVKNDEIIATGYTGAPRGRKNCTAIGHCKRQELNIKPGERYELCRSVHAEQNAIISAARKDMIGATMYLYGYDKELKEEILNPRPCSLCERMIINAGIEKVVTLTEVIYAEQLMNEED